MIKYSLGSEVWEAFLYRKVLISLCCALRSFSRIYLNLLCFVHQYSTEHRFGKRLTMLMVRLSRFFISLCVYKVHLSPNRDTINWKVSQKPGPWFVKECMQQRSSVGAENIFKRVT